MLNEPWNETESAYSLQASQTPPISGFELIVPSSVCFHSPWHDFQIPQPDYEDNSFHVHEHPTANTENKINGYKH